MTGYTELSEENRAEIITAYNRGEKTVTIQRKCHVAPGTLYRVLHDAKVALRSQDPNHPASSMEVRGRAKVPDSGKEPAKSVIQGQSNFFKSSSLSSENAAYFKKLMALLTGEIAYFKELWEKKVKELAGINGYDTYMETWIEYTNELGDRFEAWSTSLGNDTGAMALVAFNESHQAIKQLEPKEE